VTTGDSYSDPAAGTADAFVAFDSETGKLVWSRQMTAGDAFTVDCDFPDLRANCPDANGPDFDFGSSPILIELPNGRRALVAGQKSGMVHAVDPDKQAAVLWQTPHPGCRGIAGCSPAQSAAVTAIPGVVFSGGLDGI